MRSSNSSSVIKSCLVALNSCFSASHNLPISRQKHGVCSLTNLLSQHGSHHIDILWIINVAIPIKAIISTNRIWHFGNANGLLFFY